MQHRRENSFPESLNLLVPASWCPLLNEMKAPQTHMKEPGERLSTHLKRKNLRVQRGEWLTVPKA